MQNSVVGVEEGVIERLFVWQYSYFGRDCLEFRYLLTDLWNLELPMLGFACVSKLQRYIHFSYLQTVAHSA